MAAKFVLTLSEGGRYHWNLVATNGKVIATSEQYETKRAALGGIQSVRNNAPSAELVDKSSD